MTTALQVFNVAFRSGRHLRVRGTESGTSHRDFGSATFIDEGTTRVFQANSEDLSAVVSLGLSNADNDSVSPTGSAQASTTESYRIVLKSGRTLSVNGSDCVTSHKDYGCKAIISRSEQRTFECAMGELLFMCKEGSLLEDSGGAAERPHCQSQPTSVAARDIFVSHVSEDSDLALALSSRLEALGYSTWYYERDGLPGLSYLTQVCDAIERCTYFLVVISTSALSSHQMEVEIERAHEAARPIVPIRRGLAHDEIQRRRPLWRQAMGTATSVEVTAENIPETIARIHAGLRRINEASRREALGKPETG